MTDQRVLLDRLYELLVASHEPLGQKVDRIEEATLEDPVEAYPCGQSGVIAFIGEYVLTGWDPSDMPAAPRDAYRHLHERLRRVGRTRHMVYPLNFRSVILTRKLGAVPIGKDDDGYVHYILTLEAFERSEARRMHREGSSNGQEVGSPESP